MKTNILNYINKLQGYKTAIKNLHWSSKHMSEHKLLDEIADSVANNQDEIAEMCQGLYGKIKINELKPKRYKITNSKKMLFDLLRDTKSFNSSIKGRELTGVRSVVESFIGEINKFVYLMDMCIKEDIKRNFKTSLNESKNTQLIAINENELRNLIREAINNVSSSMSIEQYERMIYNKLKDNEEKTLHNIKSINQLTVNEINNVKTIINKIQVLTDVINITVEEDNMMEETNIYLELNIQNMAEEEFMDLEDRIYDNLQEFKNIEVTVSDTPNKNGNYYITLTIDNILPLTLAKMYKNEYRDDLTWDIY